MQPQDKEFQNLPKSMRDKDKRLEEGWPCCNLDFRALTLRGQSCVVLSRQICGNYSSHTKLLCHLIKKISDWHFWGP